MNAQTAAVAVDRIDIEQMVCDLPGVRSAGEMSFDKPWEIRAFALAVAAHKTGRYEWEQFQGALIDSIGQWETAHPAADEHTWSYYEHWVTALERVLAEGGVLDSTALTQRTSDVLATPANRNHHHAVLVPVAVDPRRSH